MSHLWMMNEVPPGRSPRQRTAHKIRLIQRADEACSFNKSVDSNKKLASIYNKILIKSRSFLSRK